MSFRERLQSFHLDHVKLALLALFAIALLVFGGTLINQAMRIEQRPVDTAVKTEAPPPPAAETSAKETAEKEAAARAEMRSKIELQLAQSPDYRRFFDQLKLVLPTEYDTVLDSFARRAVKQGETDNIDSMMSDAVRALRISHGFLAAKADGPVLQKIFTVQLQMMQALAAKDARLCVDFLNGNVSRGFFDFSAQNRTLVTDMALAGLDAINNGQSKKIERVAPNDADFQQLEKALRDKDLTSTEIEALLDGKTADPPIADQRMCTVGQTYLQTLSELPEATRLRLYGLAIELMARS